MNPTSASNPIPVSQRSVWSVNIFVILLPDFCIKHLLYHALSYTLILDALDIISNNQKL
jgi:hypothetical protein